MYLLDHDPRWHYGPQNRPYYVAHGVTLLSRNVTDFQKVPGLRVEDWTV